MLFAVAWPAQPSPPNVAKLNPADPIEFLLPPQLVPLNVAKKTDDEDRDIVAEPLNGRGIGPRVMSSHDLPIARLEYY